MKKATVIVGIILSLNSVAMAGESPANKAENIPVDNSATSTVTSVNETVLTKHAHASDNSTHKESTTPSEVTNSPQTNTTDRTDIPKIEMSLPEKKEHSKQKPYEIQMSYLHGGFFKDRKINRYDVDLLKQFKRNGSVTLYVGATVSRMTGYTTENGIWRDSNAWGIGPTFMFRWEKPICGKLYGSIDASASLQFYNRAHPALGRAFGFLWRAGPRLTYRYNEYEALSLGYIFHHCSNGFQSHNPGYNGSGLSLGYQKSF